MFRCPCLNRTEPVSEFSYKSRRKTLGFTHSIFSTRSATFRPSYKPRVSPYIMIGISLTKAQTLKNPEVTHDTHLKRNHASGVKVNTRKPKQVGCGCGFLIQPLGEGQSPAPLGRLHRTFATFACIGQQKHSAPFKISAH